MSNTNGTDVWEVIGGLSSTPDTNSPNEIIPHHVFTITNTKSKANIFINLYARVSKLHMTKVDCDLNRHLK